MSHARDFGRESGNDELAQQLIFDYRAADLSPADRGLCDYAVKLTLAPGAMGEAEVEQLRAHGFSDEAITVAVQVISYFNYINRIADGLGVDDEPWMTMPREEWLEKKRHDFG